MTGLNKFVQKKTRGNNNFKGHAWTLIVLKNRSECLMSLKIHRIKYFQRFDK